MVDNYIINKIEERKNRLSRYVDIMISILGVSERDNRKVTEIGYNQLLGILMDAEVEDPYWLLEMIQEEAYEEIEALEKEGKNFRDEDERSKELRDLWLGLMLGCRNNKGALCSWSERVFIRVI